MLHDIDFLNVYVKLDGLTMLGFSVGAGFILFVWPLCGVILGVLFEYFKILGGVSGAIKQACVSRTSHIIAQRDYIFCPELSRTALMGVGRRGVFPYLSFPDMAVMVVILPYDFKGGVYPLYNCLAISIQLNMAQVDLKVSISKSYPCR